MAMATREPVARNRTPTKSDLAVQRYAVAAKAAGVSRDQLDNFLRAGIVLQPKQLAASAAARECDRVEEGPLEIGFGGARGGGKSHWLLAQMGADDCQRQAGLKCLLLRKVGKANRENFEDLRRKLLMHLPHRYARQEGILTFQNGSFIVLGHFQNETDIDAYLGLEYDVIGVEEATTLTTAKYRDITTCNRTSKSGWRPRTYNSTNPGGVGHSWYKARFVAPHLKARRGGPPERETRFIPSTVRDNSFVNREYVSILERLTGWKRRAWLEGDWDIAAGQFFTTWRSDVHVIKPFPIPRGWRVWGALDYGFTHFTVFHLLAEDGDGNVYLVDEHAERGWLPQRHAPAIKALLDRHGLKPRSLWKLVAGADLFAQRGMQDGEAQTLAESYEQLGLKFERANVDRINGAGEFLVRLGDLDANPPIPPTLFIFDRCARLIECMPALEHDPHRPEDVLKVDCDEDGNGGDDPYDAARYGIMAAWRKPASHAPLTGARRPQPTGMRL
jgi:phage terminase large subunit